ncbi:Advillin [Lamellibrachia satsuma]|nr:Advillin [Lamellibrachia satsuma]
MFGWSTIECVEDVVTDDVFILDAYDNIFLWIGEDARPEEKTMAMDAAIEYLETDPSGRDTDTPIFSVKQGYEPPDFIGYFGVWDRELWSGGKSYEQLKKELGEKNLSLEKIRSKSTSSGDMSFTDVGKFPLEVLQQKDELPDGVDKDHKEKHLSSNDFQTLFKMSYEQFIQMPFWKRERSKKEHKLW